MSDRLILPGHTPDPERAVHDEELDVVATQPVIGPDGRLYALRIEGTAVVQRAPLGRFLDLREQIRGEGDGERIPSELNDVLDRLGGV